MKFTPAEEKLKEKVKELTCLYEISKIISLADSVNDEILNNIAFTIKKAWRYNEDAVVEIEILNDTISTENLVSETIFQSSLIWLSKKESGAIKVHYPKDQYTYNDFMEDEQKLLDTIAVEIGLFIEKHQILERKALLRRTLERMDRLTLLGEMTAGIAHELNTPLGNILGFAELIKDNNTDTDLDSDIETVINSVIYSREIVKKLMHFSREIPQQLQIQEIKPIIRFALSFLKPNFHKKQIKIQVHYTDDTLTAKIDSVQLTQVLFNLLLNAIYASPEKSIITISVKDDANHLVISIADEGPGIPKEIRSKIFDPFFTTKPTTDGCGLGLSVVQGIVKNHNGEISLKNNQPTGTIFKIRIPTS